MFTTLLYYGTYLAFTLWMVLFVICLVLCYRRGGKFKQGLDIPPPPKPWDKPFYENGAHYR